MKLTIKFLIMNLFKLMYPGKAKELAQFKEWHSNRIKEVNELKKENTEINTRAAILSNALLCNEDLLFSYEKTHKGVEVLISDDFLKADNLFRIYVSELKEYNKYHHQLILHATLFEDSTLATFYIDGPTTNLSQGLGQCAMNRFLTILKMNAYKSISAELSGGELNDVEHRKRIINFYTKFGFEIKEEDWGGRIFKTL